MKVCSAYIDCYSPPSVSEECRHLILHYYDGYEISGDFGHILSQVFKGTDFSIFRHKLLITHPTSLYIKSQTSMLSIAFMYKGNISICIPNMDGIELHESNYRMLYIPKNSLQVSVGSGEYECLQIVLDSNYLKRLAGKSKGLKVLLDCAIANSQILTTHEGGSIDYSLNNLLKCFSDTQSDKGETQMYFQAKIIELLLVYIRKHHHRIKSHSWTLDNNIVNDALEYIVKNIHKPMNVSELLKSMGTSRSKMQRLFHELHGTSIYQYYKRKKMEYAVNIMNEGRYSITEISDMVGFANVSSFSRAFVKTYGISPMLYLKQKTISYT